MATLTLSDGYDLAIDSGDQGTLTFNDHADLILNNPARSSSGRALVTGGGDQLVINYATDFSAGVQINGQVQLEGLTSAPAGVATTPLCVDASGNVYKAD